MKKITFIVLLLLSTNTYAQWFQASANAVIINKNIEPITIDLKRFEEVGLEGKTLKNIITGDTFIWGNEIHLSEKGSVLLTTKI